jgi:hypothetical protein
MDPRLCFPTDIWVQILTHVQLSDFLILLTINKILREWLMQEEELYLRLFASLKYPADTIDIHRYSQSWKSLLQDDNARGGCYVLTNLTVSEWFYNSHPSIATTHFYINAIRYVVWDRESQNISIIIEAYGNHDLRDTHTTTIFKEYLDTLNVTRYLPHSYHYLIDQAGHKLCVLNFSEHIFNPGRACDFWFTYSGSEDTEGSDYRCVPFLRCEPTLKDTFNLSSSECEFRPKSFCEQVKSSDVQSWGRPINDNIIQQMKLGHWGGMELA